MCRKPAEQQVVIKIPSLMAHACWDHNNYRCLGISADLSNFVSKVWSKNLYFLTAEQLISQTDSRTRNFRPVSTFWWSQNKCSQVLRCISPARVGNVTLPTPSQFLRHIWALPQTWSLPGDRYRLEISGPAFTSWKCWIPDPNLSLIHISEPTRPY